MIGVVDYGMGNLHSVEKALQRLQASAIRLSDPVQADHCQALLLPGVGAFDPAMQKLNSSGWSPVLQDWAQAQRPLLGMCLGLQLLFESSAEGREPGLGLLAGRVEPLPEQAQERCPHMGWAPLTKHQPSPLLADDEQPWMYFVHSFAAVAADSSNVTATAPYGDQAVVAAVGCGSLQATQFHPEKSGLCGLALLQRWLSSFH